jgi:short-subunit dehydrogenase
LDSLADELRSDHIAVSAHAVDVGDRDAITAAIAAVEAELGPVDLLIHNAGVAMMTNARESNLDALEEMLRVNYLGGVYALGAVLPGMLARGRGHFVGINSLGARRGMAWSACYSASKAALATYLESLRPALRKRGILVTTVYPGFVRTAMTEALPLAVPIMQMSPENAAARITRSIRKGRREVAFPWHQALLVGMLRRLPAWAFDMYMAHLGRRALKGDY